MTASTPQVTPALTMLGGDHALACVEEACMIPAAAEVGVHEETRGD